MKDIDIRVYLSGFSVFPQLLERQLAVRKVDSVTPAVPKGDPETRTRDPAAEAEYEVTLLALNEHLRNGSDSHQTHPCSRILGSNNSYQRHFFLTDSPVRASGFRRVSDVPSHSKSAVRSSGSPWSSLSASDSADNLIFNFKNPACKGVEGSSPIIDW